MRRGAPAPAWALLALAGCAAIGGGAGDPPVDAPPRDAPAPCAERTLELGRCIREAGGPCTGDLGEVRRFEALPAGGEVLVVSGPQGSAMLVFAAHTTGIVPGDPADPVNPDNPLVEVVVSRAGGEVAVYRGRVGFADVGAGVLEANGLFVITDGVDLDGAALMAHARVTDTDGAGRCGEVAFVATR